MRRGSRVLAAAAIALTGVVAGSAQAAEPRPRVESAPAFGAPEGEPGGIMTPYVGCSDYRVTPRARTTITGVDSDYEKSFRWRGAYPGAFFPRVAVGDYEVETVARCGSQRRIRSQVVTVVQKTPETTMSRAEFNEIKRGMSRAEVASIVGYDGKRAYSFRGTAARLYDNMTFWAWSIVEFRSGVVTRKSFDVDHD